MKTAKRITMMAVIASVMVFALGCTLFGSKDNDTDELGWKKTSLPGKLKGNWNQNDFFYMTISSKKVIFENREWITETIYSKEGEYRLLLKSSIQYRAIYFRNLTDSTVEKSLGYMSYTPYEAKTATRGEWTQLIKPE